MTRYRRCRARGASGYPIPLRARADLGGGGGAVAALAAERRPVRGSVVVEWAARRTRIHAPGTVARGGGKALTPRAGAWAGIDTALYAIPELLDTAWSESAWMRRDTARVRVHGTRIPRAHRGELASGRGPGRGGYQPAPLPGDARVLTFDGDVEEGGGSAVGRPIPALGARRGRP